MGELQVLVNPDGEVSPGMAKDAIKDDIIGIRRLLVKESASHTQKLDDVQRKMTEVKQKHIDASKPEMFEDVVSKSDDLRLTVAKSGSHMTYMFLIMVLSIIVIGFLMWNRMQYYERKHFL